MKLRYEEELKLLPEDTLSDPWHLFDIDKAFEKLRNYGKALLKIAQSYSLELLAELNAEVGFAGSVEVQLGVPPSLTIVFQKSFTVSATASASVARS